MKKPPPDVHHYHLHYYPVFVHSQHSVHSTLKTIKAPDKHELDHLHTLVLFIYLHNIIEKINYYIRIIIDFFRNKLESYGWAEQEFNHTPEPIIHHSSSLDPWTISSLTPSPTWAWDESSLGKFG